MSEKTAGKIRWRIGFFPSNIIQNMIANMLHQIAYHIDIMISATYPNGAVWLEQGITQTQPLFIKFQVCG